MTGDERAAQGKPAVHDPASRTTQTSVPTATAAGAAPGTTHFHWRVPADHPALPGHFPGRPIVPGVVLLDRAILCAATLGGGGNGRWRIGTAKFLSPVAPEEALTFSLEMKTSGSIAFCVRAGERDVACGSLTPEDA